MSVSKEYLDTMIERLEHMRDTQMDPIQEAAQVCADTILADNLVFTFGTGHGGFAALSSNRRRGCGRWPRSSERGRVRHRTG